MTIGHVITLLLWTFIMLMTRWASVSIFHSEELRMELESRRLESARASSVTEDMLDHVEAQVRPMLELVLSHEPLSVHARRDAQLLEAELRDEIRGGNRVTTLLKSEVRKARERGVSVILMDDRAESDISLDAMKQLRQQAAVVLQNAVEGRVVIRLVPAKQTSAAFATISAQDSWVTIEEDGSLGEDSQIRDVGTDQSSTSPSVG